MHPTPSSWRKLDEVTDHTAWSPTRVRHADALLGAVLEEFPSGVASIADAVRIRTRGRFHEELVDSAERVGRSWRALMLANVSYDLAMVTLGCSTMALAGPSGPVLARNLDWWPERELIEAAESRRTSRGGFMATWPGFCGVVTGMSDRGFAFALNAVSCRERARLTGYPVLLFLRTVFEDARDFDDALARMTRQRIAAPALFSLVGTRNEERAIIERTPTRAVVRRPQGNEPLIATNDYRALQLSGASQEAEHSLYTSACGRFDALTQRASACAQAEVDRDGALLELLRDPRVLQGITVQQVVMRPAQQIANAWVPALS